MKLGELLQTLLRIDAEPDMDVKLEQFFNEQRSVEVRTIEIRDGTIFITDHYLRQPVYESFRAFDGNMYSVPPLPERMLRNVPVMSTED